MCDKKELILKIGRIPFTSYFRFIKYQLFLLDVQIRKKSTKLGMWDEFPSLIL